MDAIRVLVVDDEDQFVDAVVERLQLRGFDAEGASNGQEALQRLHETPFDVVLLDVRMPGVGGLEVIRKAKKKWPGLQVVLLTGHGSMQEVEEGMHLGAYKCFMKPADFQDLVGTLRAASGRRKRVQGDGS